MIEETTASALQLWRRLQKEAGLELTLKRGGHGRDADLEAAVFEDLRGQVPSAFAATSLDKWLAKDAATGSPQVTVEMLLVAVLKSQRGFAAMMNYILQTLVMADARKADRSLSVQFRFSDVSDPIRMTLEEFREQIVRIERVLATRFELPRAELLWELLRGLQEFVPVNLRDPPSGFPPVSVLPRTGSTELDELLVQLTELVANYRRWCQQFGDTRQRVIEAAQMAFPDHQDREQVVNLDRARAAHDYWDVSFVGAVREIAKRARDGSIDASQAATDISPLLAKVERKQNWVDRTSNQLLDVLKLPAWQKRHELYSVWVGCVLLRAAAHGSDGLRFHPVNQVLSFSFGGSRLATYDWNGEQFDIWAELRSALVGRSAKRKKGIQPDFRVVRVSIKESINAATRLAVECKHYLRPSRSNFTEAANDYARSCPAAFVFVINHGASDQDLLTAASDPALVSRIRFVGEATAERELQSGLLEKAISENLFPPRTVVPAKFEPPHDAPIEANKAGTAASAVATIRLQWDETLSDLDLALEMSADAGRMAVRVDFRSGGDLSSPPYARLEQDVRRGPGEEVIEISAWHFSHYEIVVTNYSMTGHLPPEHLSCEITIAGERTVAMGPSVQSQAEWRVASIEVDNGQPRLRVNEPL